MAEWLGSNYSWYGGWQTIHTEGCGCYGLGDIQLIILLFE